MSLTTLLRSLGLATLHNSRVTSPHRRSYQRVAEIGNFLAHVHLSGPRLSTQPRPTEPARPSHFSLLSQHNMSSLYSQSVSPLSPSVVVDNPPLDKSAAATSVTPTQITPVVTAPSEEQVPELDANAPPANGSTTIPPPKPPRYMDPKTYRPRKRHVYTTHKYLACVYADRHPYATHSEIATRFGMDRSSVSKVLKNRYKYSLLDRDRRLEPDYPKHR